MRTFLIGSFLASLPTAGMTQAEGLFQQTWIQQYSNGNSAYFENMALVDESIIVCGQWFQGSMANQMVVSLQADNGEVNWQHYRDCCSDHARYYTPKLIDGTLYCFPSSAQITSMALAMCGGAPPGLSIVKGNPEELPRLELRNGGPVILGDRAIAKSVIKARPA